MSPVISHFSDLDLSKSYTYADYLRWQFSEMVELIKGKVVKMSPALGSFHQTISSNLHGILWTKLRKSPCRLFAAPSDVRLIRMGKNDEQIVTVVQPDLFMVCDASKIDEKGCLGSPDLVIEILSPGSLHQDLKVKYEVYEEAGIGEYWVVFPSERVIEIFLLENGKYHLTGHFTSEDNIPVHSIPGFTVPCIEVFEW